MKKFKSFIKEETGAVDMVNLDFDFLKKAQKITSFNLNATDFQSTKYKKEIQFLFRTHFFPDVNWEPLNGLDVNSYNSLINRLKSKHAREYIALHKYNVKGIGPGEVSMFVLIDNAKLGGGSSAGLDIIIGNTGYEIKAVLESKDGYIYDFKLGGTFNTSDIETKLLNLAKLADPNLKTSEVPATLMRKIEKSFPSEYNEVLEMYRDRTYNNYFKNHPIIFVKNSSKNMGKIIAVKTVRKDEIFIERYTSKSLKPKIKK